ncbi:hydroxymethylpyrimidine pyrophosphatase-like HAD family hydrolase [Clostridium saccharobutylicum]|nr:hydroxymethylpyrimidine pyrophosphatase-like HAD family hydrolase [Clostridium saccharobutylicum]
MYSKRNTKASGILKVLDFLDIPIENSYAFGDGKNDIEMLSTVGCGIAMGNASDYVKKYAKKVTDTVHNDGVALEIENFILK